MSGIAGLWERTESMFFRIGDRLSPILIKETRQSIKSRQFGLSFTFLLLAAWGVSVVGIIVQMPQIQILPTGTHLLMGLSVVLAIPAVVVIPLAGFASLSDELADGTFELLSITRMSAWRIIVGKFWSAMLQLAIYSSAVAPSLVFCMLLGGIDINSLAGCILLPIVASIFLTSVGLLLASLSDNRAYTAIFLLCLLALIGLVIWGVIAAQVGLIYEVGTSSIPMEFVWTLAIFILIIATYFSVLAMAAAHASISFRSENRSTFLRILLAIFPAIVLGYIAYALQPSGKQWIVQALLRSDRSVDVLELTNRMAIAFGELLTVSIVLAAAYWLLMGTLMCGESPLLSSRVRRKLPTNVLSQMTFGWLMPGPARGYWYAILSFVGYVLVAVCLLDVFQVSARAGRPIVPFTLADLVLVSLGYLLIILSVVRLLLTMLRRLGNSVGPVTGVIVLAAIMPLMALIPFFIETQTSSSRASAYGPLQLTNWVWTYGELLNQNLPAYVPFALMAMGIVGVILCTITTIPEMAVLPAATPDRVKFEMSGRAAESDDDQVSDPLAAEA
jgi:hypothetical protein